MSGRYWGIVCVCLALASGHALAQQVQPTEQRSADGSSASQPTQQPAASAEPVIATTVGDTLQRIAAALEAANDKQTTPEEADHSKRDLAAQEAMAKWAMFMLGVGFAEIVVTLIGLGLIYATFKATRDQLMAAKQANAIAEASANSEHRPWLEIRAPSIALRLGEGGVLFAFVELRVDNLGKTPATHVKMKAELIDLRGPVVDMTGTLGFYDGQRDGILEMIEGTNILPGGWIAEGHLIHTPPDGPAFAKVDVRYTDLIVCVTYRYLDGKIGQTGHVFGLSECNQPDRFEPPSRLIWEDFAETVTSTRYDRTI